MTPTFRRWATTSARVVVGAGVAVAAVVAVTVAVAAPWPSLRTDPVRVVATPAPSQTLLACSGPLLALGRVAEQAGEYGVAAEQRLVTGPDDVAVDAGSLTGVAGTAPVRLRAAPQGGRVAEVAAAGSASVDAADLRGLAVSSCRAPLMESWLVGGATTTGSADIVLLANPGDVAATAQLTVYGRAGAPASGGSARVVPPRTQIAVPLAGLLPGEESPVVRVTTTGAPVTATLQASLIRTLDPGGVDAVTPIAAASTRQTVPAVSVGVEPGAAPSPPTVLRLLAPAADTQARITVTAVGGAPVASPDAVPLVAGIPSEVDLGALPVGAYTVRVDADAPVVAAVWATTGFGAGSDFAWYPAAPEMSTPAVFAVPPGPDPRLTLANPGPEGATVVLTAPDGAEEDVVLAPGASAQRPVAAGSVYRLAPSGAVSAAVTFSAAGAAAGMPVWGADAAAQPIVVFP